VQRQEAKGDEGNLAYRIERELKSLEMQKQRSSENGEHTKRSEQEKETDQQSGRRSV
jgi:hypothetical protein